MAVHSPRLSLSKHARFAPIAIHSRRRSPSKAVRFAPIAIHSRRRSPSKAARFAPIAIHSRRRSRKRARESAAWSGFQVASAQESRARESAAWSGFQVASAQESRERSYDARLQTQTEIRALLASRGLTPKHRFGQNFLVDHNHLRKLVVASSIDANSLVLEVGPGTGTLSECILETGAELLACELDRDLCALLRETLLPKHARRMTLLEGDCLDGKHAISPAILDVIAGRPFSLVANLPYQIASPLMAMLACETPYCLGQFVTIQRDVADRLLAREGCGEYGPLTISIGACADVTLLSVLPPGCFWPPPKVTSAMIAIRPRQTPDIAPDPQLRKAFSAFLLRVFSNRRKQLGSILGRDHGWPAGILAIQRPEELTISQLVSLWESDRSREPANHHE